MLKFPLTFQMGRREIIRAMKPLPSLVAILSATLLPCAVWANNATTTPVGVVSTQIVGGTIGSPAINMISFPLLSRPGEGFAGVTAGPISSYNPDSKTITVENAGWSANSLSNAAAPIFIVLRSGSHEGRILGIVSNTSNSAVINDQGAPLAGLGSGVLFELIQGDTLLSAFGTPTDGVVGGSSGQTGQVDIVRIFVGGAWRNYFYNTSSSRWEQVGFSFLGSQNNTVIRPDQGAIYFRVGGNMTISSTGTVPAGNLKVVNSENGPSVLSSFFPTSTTLFNLGIHNSPNWRAVGDSGVTSANADYVRLFTGGAWRTYYFNRNGNWYNVAMEFLGTQNGVTINPGGAFITQRNGASQVSVAQRNRPYSIE